MGYMNKDIEHLANATRNPRIRCVKCKNTGEHYELAEYVNSKDNSDEIREFEEMKKYGIEDKNAWYPGGWWTVEFLKIYKCKECGQVSLYQFDSNEENYEGLWSHLDDQWSRGSNDSMENYFILDGNRLYPEFEKTDKYQNRRIKDFSPKFIEVYNQALMAETIKLDEIAGMGYRKALEFLIKDYSILRNPDKVQEIMGQTKLAQVIKTYCTDIPNFQVCAERASWLGNDEVHYIRKWKDKDLSDLKELISLTIAWIEAKLKTEEYEANMPK